MPNIVDLNVGCPSSCSLIGTASVMRNFLLLKNLPQVPTDIIEAGLTNEWYNDGNLAPTYDNLDPQALIDIGNVLSDINNLRIKHQNLNLYDDYANSHYDEAHNPNYTEYPLISINDSIAYVTMVDYGDVYNWVDADEVLVAAHTWDTKWVFELQQNKYQPGFVYLTSDPSSTQTSQIDYIVQDTQNYQGNITNNLYSVGFFNLIATNDEYSNTSYFETYLRAVNRYFPTQTNNGSGYADASFPAYNNFPVGNDYINYADPNTYAGTPPINPNQEDIDQFSTADGLQIGSSLLTPDGVREMLNNEYNDYYITSVYNPTNGPQSYINTNATLLVNTYDNNILYDKKNPTISNIDGFILNLPDLSSLGFIEDVSNLPTPTLYNSFTMVGVYCDLFNIYGNNTEIAEYQQNSDIDKWKSFIKSQTAPGCFPYINPVLSPEEYGIQGFKEVTNNALNLLDDYFPPEATVNTYDGKPLSLTHFGITSDIQTSLGFVFPLMPVSIDAILSQIDTKTDTPLGNAAKRKLASEFFNKINLALRQEAYGKAEKIGEGFKNLVGNLASSLVGQDKQYPNGLDTMLDAFQNFEITVPKSLIGRAANLVASLSGVNLKLDPISEPISWTSNVLKTEDPVDETSVGDLARDKRSWWNQLTGLGKTSSTNDPSEILLAYTSNGQRDFIRSTIQLNQYTPYYQISGFLNTDAKRIAKQQNKKNKLTKQLAKANSDIDYCIAQIDAIDKEIDLIQSSSSSDGQYKNKIQRLKSWRSNTIKTDDDAKNYLISQENEKKVKLEKTKTASESDRDKIQKSINKITIENPLPYYPTTDDGTFNGTSMNSWLKSREQLRSVVDQSGVFIPLKPVDYAESNVDTTKQLGIEGEYTHPIDKSNSDFSRYHKSRSLGLSPESTIPTDGEIYYDEIYQEVADLLKHGVNPTTNQPPDNRGLNIKSDEPYVGYNVYPVIDKNDSFRNKLIMPGLGRQDMYAGQSLFSVLESNGYVKISPLWQTDQVADTNKSKEFVTKYNPDNDYVSMVTDIHRYMFSIENLAWKGFKQQLPWQEQGANGGRIMWFPPYDLRISDTSSVALGQENLIGRNEPVYTYNHTERNGVLSFKMIMDFPGYSNPDTTYVPDPVQTVIPQSQAQAEIIVIPPLNAPKDVIIPWAFDSDTYIYIFLDASGSMTQYSNAIHTLFSSGGKLQKQLTTGSDAVYTPTQYQQKVFIFEDPGYVVGGDNIDDGRFFSWFASPYFMSQGIDSSNNTTYDNAGNPYTALPMAQRLKANIKSGNLANLPAVVPDKVICIALGNDATPAYIKYNDITQTISIPPLGRLPQDLADYISAKNNYSEFTGVILGYDWNSGPLARTYNDCFNIMNLMMFGGQASGFVQTSNINTTNNINVSNPPSINWLLSGATFDWNLMNGLPVFGNYDIGVQTININDLGNIKYQLEIGATGSGNVSGTDSGDDASVTDIVYIIKKVLTTNNELPTVTKIEEPTHDKLPILRDYLTKMAHNHPSHALGADPILIWDDDDSFIDTNDVNIIIGGSSEPNKYDIEFNKLIKNGINNESASLRPLVEVMVQLPDGSIISIIQWLQDNAGGSVNVKDDGSITSDGWALLMKIINPSDPAANVSSDPNLITAVAPKSDIPEKKTEWGIDINMDPHNQLNEFMYFKRLEQTDPIVTDTIKEKIVYFDPAFHSTTPIGFNNRLNFLEQCARQGPSINNAQDSSGNFISATSNLAFGRPPISILRIGDFYHTRIAVEGVDLSYEPLIFDLNPEGIGVQPMIVDVTINFKYLGGSSLSGPITQLQNAISNNYFANVEFYHTKALRAFERNYPDQTLVSNTNVQTDINNNAGNGAAITFDFFHENAPAVSPQNIPIDGSTTTTSTNQVKKDESNQDKAMATNKCPVCPSGWSLYQKGNATGKATNDVLCVVTDAMIDGTSGTLYGFAPCRTTTNPEDRKAAAWGKKLNRPVDYVSAHESVDNLLNDTSKQRKFRDACIKQGCADLTLGQYINS